MTVWGGVPVLWFVAAVDWMLVPTFPGGLHERLVDPFPRLQFW